jgi:sporulation protein YlmC with PRC-barrel domain
MVIGGSNAHLGTALLFLGAVIVLGLWMLSKLFPKATDATSAQSRMQKQDCLRVGAVENDQQHDMPNQHVPGQDPQEQPQQRETLRRSIMDIPINAKVQCADGPCGRSTYVVVNPITEEVTHLVVHENGFAKPDRLVPIEQIAASTPEQITLTCTRKELDDMEQFIEVEYVPADHPHQSYQKESYLMWPYTLGPSPLEEPEFYKVEHEMIPPGELAIRRNANVKAADGYVGHVDEFLVSPQNNHISHLILREGHLWGKKDVTIPVSEIDHVDEDTVYLKLDKAAIKALPAVPIKRWWN